MTKRVLISTVVIAVLYLVLFAFFERDVLNSRLDRLNHKPEAGHIENAIALYNNIYTDLYVSDGIPARLNEFPASTQLRHELFRNLGFLREEGMILVYDMADMRFLQVDMISPSRAEATVYEEWNYVYQDIETRKPVRPVKGMGQGFRYILNRDDGKWIVVDYYPEEVEVEKKNEFLY